MRGGQACCAGQMSTSASSIGVAGRWARAMGSLWIALLLGRPSVTAVGQLGS